MISFLCNLFGVTPITDYDPFDDRGCFTQAFNDLMYPDHPQVKARQQRQEEERRAAKSDLDVARLERDTARVTAAYVFLKSGFDKLADEQDRGLANATVGDYTEQKVKRFEEKLSLAYRLLVQRSETSFGKTATDKGLEECGFDAMQFRFRHKCR